ncbi:MAG: hypothetical protein DMF60_20840 [Acidobacteria bacterium]|nr:MAG: hypothetical protein DMF60_20840 [Acidobacteriota bacterium]
MAAEDVLYLSVRELGERIRSRRLSPVELTEGYLERSARIGAKLNAYATLTRELTLKPASTAARCTESRTPQKTCWPSKVIRPRGARGLMQIRSLTMTRR